MISTLPYKTKQFFFVLTKLSLVLAAFYVIYQKTFKNPHTDFLFFDDFLYKNELFSLKIITFLLFLTIFNWFLEILKWQTLVSQIERISFKNAMAQCLGSLTASIMTPNRIGEYGAKAIYFKKKHRKHIMVINLLGNGMQMAVTSVFGIIGLTFFVYRYPVVLVPFKHTLVAIILVGILSFILYKTINRTINMRGFSIKNMIAFFKNFPKNKVYLGLILSYLRYFIFSFQFYYLLILFKTNITYLDAMMAISAMYFLASIIPSIFIFDAVVKAGIALYLFSFLNINEYTILTVVTSMWLLNLALPCIFGSIYVLNFKFPKEIEYKHGAY